MCYLVAKKRDQIGCFAYKTNHGPQLVNYMRELNSAVLDSKVQLVTISRPIAYGEYKPYKFIDNKDEFTKAVLSLK